MEMRPLPNAINEWKLDKPGWFRHYNGTYIMPSYMSIHNAITLTNCSLNSFMFNAISQPHSKEVLENLHFANSSTYLTSSPEYNFLFLTIEVSRSREKYYPHVNQMNERKFNCYFKNLKVAYIEGHMYLSGIQNNCYGYFDGTVNAKTLG